MIQRFLLVFCFCLFSLEQTVAQHSTESTFYGHTLADEGAWCWFADPRALHFESKDKTVSITLIGYIDRHGNIKARQIDWKTGLTEEVLVRSYFQPSTTTIPPSSSCPTSAS